MMTPAGGIINEDGSITQLDGSITNSDGSVADPEVVEADASSESTEAPEEDATEAEADVEELEVLEESETPAADPVSDKKAYAAVFMGWSLEDGRDMLYTAMDSRNAGQCGGSDRSIRRGRSERCDDHAVCVVG